MKLKQDEEISPNQPQTELEEKTSEQSIHDEGDNEEKSTPLDGEGTSIGTTASGQLEELRRKFKLSKEEYVTEKNKFSIEEKLSEAVREKLKTFEDWRNVKEMRVLFVEVKKRSDEMPSNIERKVLVLLPFSAEMSWDTAKTRMLAMDKNSQIMTLKQYHAHCEYENQSSYTRDFLEDLDGGASHDTERRTLRELLAKLEQSIDPKKDPQNNR